MGKIAQVSLSPINGSLFSGVPTRSIVYEDKFKVKSYSPKNTSIGFSTEILETFEDGYVFNLKSLIKVYSEFYSPSTKVWIPFVMSGCKIKSFGSDYKSNGKFAKINQKFRITGEGNFFVQFFCDQWNVRFREEIFSREDILSCYFNKKITNIFPMRTVSLDKMETFIPSSKNTRVNLIVDKSRGKIEDFESELFSKKEINFGHSFPSLGTPMALNCFIFNENFNSTQSLSYLHKTYTNDIEKRIIHFVPLKREQGIKYFSMDEPLKPSKVVLEGINYFKIKSNSAIKIADNCPIECSKKENDLYYLFNIKCPCPVVLLDKTATELLIKCP